MNNKKQSWQIKLHKMMFFSKELMMTLHNIRERSYRELINWMLVLYSNYHKYKI